MKLIIFLFSAGLIFISHQDEINQLVRATDNYINSTDLTAEAPKINISIDELNRQFAPIAEDYEVTGPVVIHFIVTENGSIREPSLSDSYNSSLSEKIVDLIKKAGIEPGKVSGKATSNGMGLMLSATRS